MRKYVTFSLVAVGMLVLFSGCSVLKSIKGGNVNFGSDIAFLKEHTDVFVLESPDSEGRVAVIPGMQARVMTRSAEGDKGDSFGWINRELIPKKEKQDHINVFGGEDRFWLGPEGGQYSIFFKTLEFIHYTLSFFIRY